MVCDGKALTSSCDVAALFEKSHDNVLRDIKVLEASPDLDRSFFIGSADLMRKGGIATSDAALSRCGLSAPVMLFAC